MTTYYVELQDASGTYYDATCRWSLETIYFEDLDEARMYAKSQLSEQYIVSRVIDNTTYNVVDYFQT